MRRLLSLLYFTRPGRPHMKLPPFGAVCLLLLLVTSCREPEADRPVSVRTPGLQLVQSSGPVPFSRSYSFATISPTRVCLLDTYNTQIVCGDRAWADTVRLGREGAGPGEIRNGGFVVSGPGSGLGYVDLKNRRVSLFSDELAFTRSVPLGEPIQPIGPISSDSVLGGLVLDPRSNGRVSLVSLREGSTDRAGTRILAAGQKDVPSLPVTAVVSASSGEMVARLGLDHLAWFAPDGGFRALSSLPDFGKVYPSDRDVEEYVATLGDVLGRPPHAPDVARYRQAPKSAFRGGQSFALDHRGRLWAVTERSTRKGTYLDVFEASGRLGSVLVPGRVLGIEVRGSLLVALTERDDVEAPVRPKHFAWYRITEPGS